MESNFTKYAFTDSVKAEQEKHGSRESYQRMEQSGGRNQITQREIGHILRQDSFYMATVGENGWPYVQFRGGPKGFIKVIDNETLGFADFRGNMQYISTGNIKATDKASLILLHYPSKSRLKIWAKVEILDPDENPELRGKLVDSEYGAHVERLVVYHIKAYDWNCPQHIPQKFTKEEMQPEFDEMKNRIETLENQLKAALQKAN
jgi:predicted pyridoxine 5'-phosphate oxidase superfamily flavin-nucleotide-binding protein